MRFLQSLNFGRKTVLVTGIAPAELRRKKFRLFFPFAFRFLPLRFEYPHMRLKITLQLDRTATIPADHQHELQALIYDFLNRSSPEFARFLHDEGYATGTPNGDTRRFKAFVFSGLRVHRSRRRLANGGLTILPGTVDWFLSSPKEEFVRHLATGLLSRGGHLRIAQTRFEIVQAAALPTPEFREREEYVCLSPLVAAVPTPDGKGTRYLLPSDGEAFSNAIRCNLLRKYARAERRRQRTRRSPPPPRLQPEVPQRPRPPEHQAGGLQRHQDQRRLRPVHPHRRPRSFTAWHMKRAWVRRTRAGLG